MGEDEFLYRVMNPEDPWYMGDREEESVEPGDDGFEEDSEDSDEDSSEY